jgi:hypothetical protein
MPGRMEEPNSTPLAQSISESQVRPALASSAFDTEEIATASERLPRKARSIY